MARLILKLSNKDKLQVDHIDRNGLNNQKSNLRIVTSSQNMINRRTWGKSKYIGVSIARIKNKNKWQSLIAVDKKLIKIGTFDTEIEAAKARDKMAKKLHGEFANLNFK